MNENNNAQWRNERNRKVRNKMGIDDDIINSRILEYCQTDANSFNFGLISMLLISQKMFAKNP